MLCGKGRETTLDDILSWPFALIETIALLWLSRHGEGDKAKHKTLLAHGL